MTNLLQTKIEAGEAPSTVLAEISGENRPIIGKNVSYTWRVNLFGCEGFTYLKNVRVIFKLKHYDRTIAIGDIAPKRDQEEKATLTLSVVPQVQVSLPLTDEQVRGRITPEGAEWTFSDITLRRTLQASLMGTLAVKFQPDDEGNKISVQMRVEPDFRRKYLWWIKCPQQPVIDFLDVSDHTESIIPYDPDFGKPAIDNPDKERIQEYEWEIEEGILNKKPGIRNVALRTKTFSLILSGLQEKIPPKQYQEAMRSVGFKIGENFVEDMASKDRKLTPIEWSNYDSAAGMGRFIFYDKDGNIIKDNLDELQKIEVKNSFIAYDRRSNEPVCDFFSGYFEGVSGRICGERFIVIEEKCKAQGAPCCVFKVRKGKNT